MREMTSMAAMLASLRQQELLDEARRIHQQAAARSASAESGVSGPAGLPLLTKLGAALIVAGLLAEVLSGTHPHPEAHLGHLVVLLGMVLALVGIVIRGIRIRFTTPNGEPSHAIR
jgi:hypothetical protein